MTVHTYVRTCMRACMRACMQRYIGHSNLVFVGYEHISSTLFVPKGYTVCFGPFPDSLPVLFFQSLELY